LIKRSNVAFISEKLEQIFNSLPENETLKKQIKIAIENLKENAFTGIRIPKRLFPKEYIVKYEITNLWKYDLPDGWRLIYTLVSPSKIEVVSIILEWLNHPNYERRFGY
jgi:Txe/YoeB family toxin of Txe-Axe toxin-antitoxin module